MGAYEGKLRGSLLWCFGEHSPEDPGMPGSPQDRGAGSREPGSPFSFLLLSPAPAHPSREALFKNWTHNALLSFLFLSHMLRHGWNFMGPPDSCFTCRIVPLVSYRCDSTSALLPRPQPGPAPQTGSQVAPFSPPFFFWGCRTLT